MILLEIKHEKEVIPADGNPSTIEGNIIMVHKSSPLLPSKGEIVYLILC